MVSNLVTQCPMCDSFDHHKLFSLKQGQLNRCHVCQFVFSLPRPTPQELENYYNSKMYLKTYVDSPMTGRDFAENRYQQFIRSLNRYQRSSIQSEGKILLDVGSGTGDFLHVASMYGWQVEGIEISESSARRANQLLGKDLVRIGTLNDCNLLPDSYDLITSYHVIEHLIEPISMLKNMFNLLKPGGIVFLETPNIGSMGAMIRGEKWSNIKPPEHISYFNSVSLRYGLEKVGFVNIYTYSIRPQKIEVLQKIPSSFRLIANAIYGIAPFLNIGASLQAIAIKPFVE